ncbi:MAG: ABC transporter ATP-binding protein [Jatrophihabitantaceae bacterium]
MANSAIVASGLRVVRGGTEILRGLDFEVPAGRVTGLLGPSGCGKTTLIRAIAGTQRRQGSLRVLDRPAGDPALRTQVGYAAQTGAVYADLTVAENLRYFAAVLHAAPGDVARVIDEVDLAASRDRLVGRLSGGQRSRVSLAVALLGTPRLLLLDEPTVGLDPVLREQLWQTFGRLATEGMTLLVSSHVMDEARRCDQLLLMRDGVLMAQESPQSLRERTRSDDLEQAFLTLIRDTERAA